MEPEVDVRPEVHTQHLFVRQIKRALSEINIHIFFKVIFYINVQSFKIVLTRHCSNFSLASVRLPACKWFAFASLSISKLFSTLECALKLDSLEPCLTKLFELSEWLWSDRLFANACFRCGVA